MRYVSILMLPISDNENNLRSVMIHPSVYDWLRFRSEQSRLFHDHRCKQTTKLPSLYPGSLKVLCEPGYPRMVADLIIFS